MRFKDALALLVFNAFSALAQDESSFTKASNDSLLWGPYRPNLYFGIRPRLPNSLSTGLLWGRVEDYQKVSQNVRFTCEQHEGMAGYGWDAYDPRTGGVQTIHDKDNGIDIETSFVKFDEGRGGWGARIKGTVREDAEPEVGSQTDVAANLKTAVFFTVSADGLGSTVSIEGADVAELGFDRNVVMKGQTSDLGDFRLTVTEPESNTHPVVHHEAGQSKSLDKTFVHSVQLPAEALWQGKGMFRPFQS